MFGQYRQYNIRAGPEGLSPVIVFTHKSVHCSALWFHQTGTQRQGVEYCRCDRLHRTCMEQVEQIYCAVEQLGLDYIYVEPCFLLITYVRVVQGELQDSSFTECCTHLCHLRVTVIVTVICLWFSVLLKDTCTYGQSQKQLTSTSRFLYWQLLPKHKSDLPLGNSVSGNYKTSYRVSYSHNNFKGVLTENVFYILLSVYLDNLVS